MPQTDAVARAYYNKQYAEAAAQREQLRAAQLAYGLSQEIHSMPIINHYFKDNITPTSQYCPYDFTGLITHNLYELKSVMYPLSQYPTVVIDLQKITAHKFTPQLIFVFSFKEDSRIDYYYIPYNYETFMTFPVRDIRLKRGGVNTVVDIPKSALIAMN
jgi:hypothetical protein